MKYRPIIILTLLFTVSFYSFAQKKDTLIIKFAEGSYVRVKKQSQGFLKFAIIVPEYTEVIGKVDVNSLSRKLDAVDHTLRTFGTYDIRRLFTETEKFYDEQKTELEDLSEDSIPDFNLYYQIIIRYEPGMNRDMLIKELLSDKSVIEAAYPKYYSSNAGILSKKSKQAFTGWDFSKQQNYLNAAPVGVDALYAWTIPGGLGDSITIIDIEQNWNQHHEDFPKAFVAKKRNNNNYWDSCHGTAVLGEMISKHNKFGINGISPNARFGLIEVDNRYSVSHAVLQAIRWLKKGDIILIEQHTLGPASNKKSVCNDTQFEFVPMEYYLDCFDAIKAATSKGIIVIEAAGNGQMDLDDEIYERVFDTSFRNSGAIMIGADEGGNRIPACFTNYGKRVNFFGWGDSVITTGYGDLNNVYANCDSSYTGLFSGTSSASPIIAASIACLQGIRKRQHKLVWTAADFMNNIKGTMQKPETKTKYIGRLPDLRQTIIDMK